MAPNSSQQPSTDPKTLTQPTPDPVAASPFAVPDPPPRPFVLRRWLRQTPPGVAVELLKHLLTVNHPAALSSGYVLRKLREYGLSEARVAEVCDQVWTEAFKTFLADDRISDAEAAYLAVLRRPLNVGEDVVMEAEQRFTIPRYRKALRDALADQELSAEEHAHLEQLAAALRISPALQRDLYSKDAKDLLQAVLTDILADRRLSPEEFTHFAALAKHLGINASFEEATEALMHRYALYWRIEHGDIPAVDVPIALQRGETCHFVCQARWLEHRRQTRTTGYYSSGVSVRVARGLYYRFGSSRPQRVTTEGLAEIDRGVLYLTNKRVLFDGATRNWTIRWATIIAFHAYSDGIVLEKGTGKSPHLVLDGDAELAAVLCGALLAGA